MSDQERIKRPKLDRTQPIRTWSTLFGAPAATGDTERPASLQDVVSRSVDLGYRVVDEYIRRGQKAAQGISNRSYGSDAVSKDMQELTGRMSQYASELATVWVDLLQLAVGNALSGAPPQGNGGRVGTPGAPATASTNGAANSETLSSAPTRVKIEVASARFAEVSLDLRAGATTRPLVVHALRAVDPAKPRLTEVAFKSATGDEAASLRLRVPADQPAGIYNGLIIDEETSQPVGTVSVRIAAE